MSGYFSPERVLLRGVVQEAKHPIYVTIFACLVWPLYQASVDFCLSHEISDRFFFIGGTCIIHTGVYIVSNTFFLLCDHLGYMQSYKMHRTKAMQPAPALYQKTLVDAGIGQAIIAPISLYFVYDVYKYCGVPSMTAPLPPFLSLFWMFFVANIVNGWGFYFAHRFFHAKWLYPYIHKVGLSPLFFTSPLTSYPSCSNTTNTRGPSLLQQNSHTQWSKFLRTSCQRLAAVSLPATPSSFGSCGWQCVYRRHTKGTGSAVRGLRAVVQAVIVQAVIAHQRTHLFVCLSFDGLRFSRILYLLRPLRSGYSFVGTWAHTYLGLTHGSHAAYHDFHHTGNRGNFGGPEYLDYFGGTLQPWMDIGGVEGYLAQKEKEKAAASAGEKIE
jgi:hypothetical protein